MSQINFDPLRQSTVGTDPAASQTRSQPSTPPQSGSAGDTATTDTVTLSAAARAAQPQAKTGSDLTDSEAGQTALNIRQQLGAQNLSGTAKQNQAILSLLRG